MPIALSISHDLDRLDITLLRHERALKKKAVPQAINRTLRTVRSHSAKDISAGYKQKIVRGHIKERKASSQTLRGELNAVSGKAENLIQFVRPSQQNPYTFRKRTKRALHVVGNKLAQRTTETRTQKQWSKTDLFLH